VTAPCAGQQQELDERQERAFGIQPDLANFIVGEDALARRRAGFGPRHTFHDRCLEIIRPRRVPVEDPAHVTQRAVGHDGAVLKLDVVQHRHDLAPPNFTDRPFAENWKHQPLKINEAAGSGAVVGAEGELVGVALQPTFDLEVTLNDGGKGIGLDGSPLGPGLLFGVRWVAVLLNFVQGMGGGFACCRERNVAEAQLLGLASEAEADSKAFEAARLDDAVQAASSWVGYFTPCSPRLEVTNCNIG
jgi:hypothetical protein